MRLLRGLGCGAESDDDDDIACGDASVVVVAASNDGRAVSATGATDATIVLLSTACDLIFNGIATVGFFAVGGLVEAVPCFALAATSLALMSRGLRGGSGLAT